MESEREAPPGSRVAEEPLAQSVRIEEFLGEAPTRDLARWRWLWEGDHAFPLRSHRGVLGGLLVFAKRLLRPFVRVPANDLWERQRIFNLILLERLQRADPAAAGLAALAARVGWLEASLPERLAELLRHNDALFARLDQKVDLYRRQARDLSGQLGAALAVAEVAAGQSSFAPLVRAVDEQGYLELERRFRGTESEIGERLAPYLERLRERGPVLDLGCGRGESLALLREHGIPARGIDASSQMVTQCRERGLDAVEGDLFAVLAGEAEGSLGAVVSFHVIEHLPPEAIERLVRLAYRALRTGGMLILETPNPLSVVVAARNFWLDPTHRRPVHPESLALACRLAGFDPVERLDLRPFQAQHRLPEIELTGLGPETQALAERVNELRDRLDELLFGFQDYAIIAEKR